MKYKNLTKININIIIRKYQKGVGNMRYKEIDFSRILTCETIENIDSEAYNKIIKYCNICHNKHTSSCTYNGKKKTTFDGKVYFYTYEKYRSIPCAPINMNLMADAEHYKNSSYYLICDLDKKYKELILTNYIFQNDELFLKCFNQNLALTKYQSIQEFINEVDTLESLYRTDEKKFNFIKKISRFDINFFPIFKFFIEYYSVDDPVIIINKLNEIVTKKKELLDENKQYIKK